MPDATAFHGLAAGGWQQMEFTRFRDGIEICTLQAGHPQVALLRYAPGARAPRHRHSGLECVLVLEGSQSDENGHYTVGSLVMNPPGSEHSVWSEDGCVVLIHWATPVEFLEPA
ncbi:allophanate hydrolase [Pseudooceanicola sp. 216_PA32_1]|uniref:Allophanate hydrolase n=1 Tax=Pseudooceanicola pacificus TaxID=2676438 RepID=A0A844WCP1_9RHOB|nr:cupin domain-containing protein [Pseudooceanicola pacificus]MWB78808.1 allophanate hydrolase [Pseudooceanicola pacificus]